MLSILRRRYAFQYAYFCCIAWCWLCLYLYSDEHVNIDVFERFFFALCRNFPQLIACTWPLLVPVAGFAMFVLINGSIVVGNWWRHEYSSLMLQGDHSHHNLVLHLAMPLHVAPFLCLLLGPLKVYNDVRHMWQARSASDMRNYAAVCCVVGGVLLMGCKSHPFLLADNR